MPNLLDDVAERVRTRLGAVPDLPPLVAAYEIGKLLGLGRQRVSQIAASPDFPAPVATLQVGRLWLLEDIEEWARARGRTLHPLDQARSPGSP